jgi:peroxiredoxin
VGLKGRLRATALVDYGPFAARVANDLEFDWTGAAAQAVAPHVGVVATDFRLPVASDRAELPIQLSLLRGRPVLLAFFCRCGRCIDMARHLAGVASGRAAVLAVFGDPAMAQPEVASAFRDATGLAAPFLLDRGANVAHQYDAAACPRLWAIDAGGIVRYAGTRPDDPPARTVAGALAALRLR